MPDIPQLNTNFVSERSVDEVGIRGGLKPLNVVQPEGPSFTVDGNHVSWQKWDFRVSFNYREGLVLHNLRCKIDWTTYEPTIVRASSNCLLCGTVPHD